MKLAIRLISLLACVLVLDRVSMLWAQAAPRAHTFARNFTIDEALSAFTWSMSVRVIQESDGQILADLGPADIDSIPPGNNFHLRGAMRIEVPPFVQGTAPLSPRSLRFRGGDALIVPNLAAEYRPVAFLPPLATVNISNLHIALFSSALPVGPSGTFAGLASSLTDPNQVPVVPSCVPDVPNCQSCMTWTLAAALGGTTGSSCMDRKRSDPEPINGALLRVGNSLQLDLNVSELSFTFNTIINPDEPLANQRRATGTITLSGFIRASTPWRG